MKTSFFKAATASLCFGVAGFAAVGLAQENKPAVVSPQPPAPPPAPPPAQPQPQQPPAQGQSQGQAPGLAPQPSAAAAPAPASGQPAPPASPTTLPVFGDLNVLFTNLDGDNDGKLTRQEFLKMLSLYPGYQPGGAGSQTSTGNPGSVPTKEERAGSNADVKVKK